MGYKREVIKCPLSRAARQTIPKANLFIFALMKRAMKYSMLIQSKKISAGQKR